MMHDPIHHSKNPRFHLFQAMRHWFEERGRAMPHLRYGGVNPVTAFHQLHYPYKKKILFLRRRRRLLENNMKMRRLISEYPFL